MKGFLRLRLGLCCAGLTLATFTVLVFGVSSVFAAEPWWHVNTISAPAVVSGGEGRLVLEVSDLGDAAVNGAIDPVSIVDRLPAGVEATHVYGEGGGSAVIGQTGVLELLHCAISGSVASGQTVTCSYAGPLLAYERFMIAITVVPQEGSGDGVSEVDVAGGGAPSVVWRHPLALEGGGRFGVENYELTPEEEGGAVDTQAGSHPFQLTSTLTFATKAPLVHEGPKKGLLPEVQPVVLAKDLRFTLPAGLVGNPVPLPKCSLATFVKKTNTSFCPNNTVVGVATPIITNVFDGHYVPYAFTVPLYSIEPAVGEPARFGFDTAVGPVVLNTSVVPSGDGDYSVVVSVPDIPDDVGFIGSQVTFWGVPADTRHDTARGTCLDEYEGHSVHNLTKLEKACPSGEKAQPFVIMPGSCEGPLQTMVESDSWEGAGQYNAIKRYTFANNEGAPVAQDGCDHLNFEPSISVAPGGAQGSTPTGLTVSVHVDQESSLNPTGLSEASVRNTTVTLPAGVALNPSGASGLTACPLLTGKTVLQEEREERGEVSGIDLESAQPANCPESSKIGKVTIHTPLLEHNLEGGVYLGTPAPNGEAGMNPFNNLIAIYIVAKDPVSGVLVKLAGRVEPNEQTGQLTSTFTNTPQLPFENLELEFFGGSRAPLGTPAFCGAYTTSASILPWSGNPAAEIVSPPFEITSQPPDEAFCQSPLPFTPSLTAGALNLQAGAFTPFTMTMSREDGNQNLQAINLDMPSGLSGLLNGVELCHEAQANAGTCGAGSLLGETTVSVGLGANPYSVTGGKVYITEKYDGAPFGLSIVNPANAGPFHLGNVIVRAKIEVNPITAALTITSNEKEPYAIPQYIRGIPLQIKHVNVTIDRPNFTFNPTDCNPSSITGSLRSSEGATSALSVPFQVTNCATLQFKPGFKVTTSAKTSRKNGASLHVQITYPKAPFGTQANIKSVKVDLPRQLPSRLTTLQKACVARVFEAGPENCPAESKVGYAKAVTPLLPVALEGSAYFVSYGDLKFPELISCSRATA